MGGTEMRQDHARFVRETDPDKDLKQPWSRPLLRANSVTQLTMTGEGALVDDEVEDASVPGGG